MTRPGWHTCADCPDCDGDATHHCTWSAFNDGQGHQDAACNHDGDDR